MRAGRMTRRIELQAPTVASDGNWGTSGAQAWTTYATTWADMVPLEPGEREQEVGQQQLRAGQRYRLRLRYRTDLTADHRIKLVNEGTYLGISAIMDRDDARRELVLECVQWRES